MGCTSAHPNDGQLQIKSAPLKSFLINCQQLQFNEAYVCKKTAYEYKYVRGLREWVLKTDKQLFIDEQPVLLSPCNPGQFSQLLEKIALYKNRSLDQLEQTRQLNGFPQNIGMLLQRGQKFPSFETSFLGSSIDSSFEVQQGESYIFVNWKLQEKITMNKQPLNTQSQLLTSRSGGLFKQNNKSFLQTAFQRALLQISKLGSQIEIIGVCFDSADRKNTYDQHINDENLSQYRHIWIEKSVSKFSTDQNDLNPYENQAFQVFRFAQNDVQFASTTRGLDNSIYLVKNGIFQDVLQENFSDEGFIQNIKDSLNQQVPPEVQNIQLKTQKYTNQIQMIHYIPSEDYRKYKKIVTEVIKSKVHKGNEFIQIGDSFSFRIEKFTYFANFKKIATIYKKPTLNAASSIKYTENFEKIMSSLKSEFSSDQIIKDFKRVETIDKKAFFKMLSQKMNEFGYNDVRFILEIHQVLYFSHEEKRFVITRKLDHLHNAPLSIGSVFSRKTQMDKIKQWLLENQSKLALPVGRLLKHFVNNKYGFTSAFHVGQMYSPIPNVYKISHINNFTQPQPNIFFSSLQNAPTPKQSQKLFGSLQSSQIQDNSSNMFQGLPLPKSTQKEQTLSQSQQQSQQGQGEQQDIEISVNWEGQENQADMNYDQTDTLKQISNEVLIIMQIDFRLDTHLNTLTSILNHIRSKQWTKDQIRVVTIGLSNDTNFDDSLTIHKLEKDMSSGIYEPWFSVEKTFNGVAFEKLLEDLYDLNCKQNENVLVVDSHKKLAYKGQFNDKLVQLLDTIVNGSNTNTVYPFDHLLRDRIKQAQYEREWNKIKTLGYYQMKENANAKDLEEFLSKYPLTQHEFWRLETRSFQLWNEQGKLVGKFYERPRLGYRFDRPDIQAKFEHLNIDVIKQVGANRIDVHDLGKVEPQLVVQAQQLRNLKVSTQQPSKMVQSIYYQQ